MKEKVLAQHSDRTKQGVSISRDKYHFIRAEILLALQ